MFPTRSHNPWDVKTHYIPFSALQQGQWVKNLPAVQETQETWVQSLGWEDPLQEVTATQPGVLAWRILMERGAWWAVQSVGSQRA